MEVTHLSIEYKDFKGNSELAEVRISHESFEKNRKEEKAQYDLYENKYNIYSNSKEDALRLILQVIKDDMFVRCKCVKTGKCMILNSKDIVCVKEI